MIAIINVFFIPMISLVLYYRDKGKEFAFSAEYISLYMSFCAIVTVASRIVVFIARYTFFTGEMYIDSSYHSIIAMIISIIIPVALKNIKLTIRKNDENKIDKV